jgi:hypothetical protein
VGISELLSSLSLSLYLLLVALPLDTWLPGVVKLGGKLAWRIRANDVVCLLNFMYVQCTNLLFVLMAEEIGTLYIWA